MEHCVNGGGGRPPNGPNGASQDWKGDASQLGCTDRSLGLTRAYPEWSNTQSCKPYG